jgi:hypothetical protein
MGQSKGRTRQAGARRADPRRRQGGIADPSATSAGSRLQEAEVVLDAEDIALARLQARLRQAETIHASPPVAKRALGRASVRLPELLLQRVRDRAARDGSSISEVVKTALERFLRAR